MAILGEVFPKIIAIDMMPIQHNLLTIRYFVDRELSNDDKDSISIIETEVYADMPDIDIKSEVILGGPTPTERGELCLFRRRPEEGPSPEARQV